MAKRYNGMWDDEDTRKQIAGVRRLITGLRNRAANDDPWAAAEMLALSRELEDAAYEVIGELRGRGYRWADIAQAQGVNEIAAHKRYFRWLGRRAKADASS